jgi:putative membrane protein
MREHEREMVEKLTKLRGGEFDEAYMEAMVEDHAKDLEAFRAQADEGESEIDRWAARMLPTLDAHLRLAERVEAAVAASGE